MAALIAGPDTRALVEALAPFAAYADTFDVGPGPDDLILLSWHGRHVTVGDLRRARAASQCCPIPTFTGTAPCR